MRNARAFLFSSPEKYLIFASAARRSVLDDMENAVHESVQREAGVLRGISAEMRTGGRLNVDPVPLDDAMKNIIMVRRNLCPSGPK